jgi:hypothetical protein
MVESGNGEIDGTNMLQFYSNLLLVKKIVAALMKDTA